MAEGEDSRVAYEDVERDHDRRRDERRRDFERARAVQEAADEADEREQRQRPEQLYGDVRAPHGATGPMSGEGSRETGRFPAAPAA